jgi:hypothetical protein
MEGPSELPFYVGDAARALASLAVLVVAATAVRRTRPDVSAPLVFGIALAAVNVSAPFVLRWLSSRMLDHGAATSDFNSWGIVVMVFGFFDAATMALGAWSLAELAKPPPWARPSAPYQAPPGGMMPPPGGMAP